MAHTPGPWVVEGAIGANGPAFHTIKDSNGCVLASTWAGPHEDNARILAAAPELLEALRAITKNYADFVDSVGAMGNSVNHTDIPEIVAALAAIAKATGATP